MAKESQCLMEDFTVFLSLLEENQKIAFMDLAQRLIDADGRLAPEEIELFHGMMTEMELPKIPNPTNRSIEDLAKIFGSRKAKCITAMELIGLGHSDNDFAPAERKMLQELFGYFNLSEAEIVAMENWVVRQLAMVREAKQYWKEN